VQALQVLYCLVCESVCLDRSCHLLLGSYVSQARNDDEDDWVVVSAGKLESSSARLSLSKWSTSSSAQLSLSRWSGGELINTLSSVTSHHDCRNTTYSIHLCASSTSPVLYVMQPGMRGCQQRVEVVAYSGPWLARSVPMRGL
jgi:hypothetical protein